MNTEDKTHTINLPLIDTSGVGLEDPIAVRRGLEGLQGQEVERNGIQQAFNDVGAELGEMMMDQDGNPTDKFKVIPQGGGPTIGWAEITKK